MILISSKEKDSLFTAAINIYQYGSIVYGTYNKETSDVDYVVIIPDASNFPEQAYIEKEQFNIFKESNWLKMCQNAAITAVETYFLDNKFIIKENHKYEVNLTTENIRREFSAVASNSFVKAKKKLIVEKDFEPYIAKKSLWHSLRLLMFEKQLLSEGKIYNYQEANYFYEDITNNSVNDWNFYKEKYQPIYNSLKTECRLLEHKY